MNHQILRFLQPFLHPGLHCQFSHQSDQQLANIALQIFFSLH